MPDSRESDHGSEAQAVWEEHYGARQQVWSGRVNAQLAAIAPDIVGTKTIAPDIVGTKTLAPGDTGMRALDLGCGEGADAIWLAEHGWSVVAVDVSPTALNRGRAEARARGVADRIDFQQHDLATGFPEGPFDLVTSHFLHSTVAMDRPAILRRAAATVAPGGSLLIVDHAAAPPWATRMHHHVFPTAAEVVDGLALDPQDWHTVRVDSVDRAAQGPDGEDVVLRDNVILMRRAGRVR